MESEPVRDLVGGMERGEVCPDALSPQELSACLMREGRLLRTVTDATCQSLRLGKAECEAAHAQASQMLRRFGLAGDSALLRLATPHLATSPYTSLDLLRSRYISLYLPISPRRRLRAAPPRHAAARPSAFPRYLPG